MPRPANPDPAGLDRFEIRKADSNVNHVGSPVVGEIICNGGDIDALELVAEDLTPAEAHSVTTCDECERILDETYINPEPEPTWDELLGAVTDDVEIPDHIPAYDERDTE